ncbi:MAG: UvrD-helicase domain-containing protein [Cyclobacteriaceae bacterium]|nr:UvrD-helicase domain-containing protein [Cyclobacteriaceae bacterium]
MKDVGVMIENAEQLEAVKSQDKRILVLAGAGSGKTKTLIDKIKFYINEKRIAPKNILTITFTRDAIHEIQDRLIEYADKTNQYKAELTPVNQYSIRKKYINQNSILKNLTVRTFHSLCFSILKENGAGYYDNRFRLLQDKTESFRIDDSIDISPASESIDSLLRKSIISACQNDALFSQKLEQYLIENYFEKQVKDLRDNKQYNNKQYRCFNGAIVKSKSEQKIIDWFHCKGYEVEYEPLEIGSSFKFKPDIKLSTKEFYIEHKSDLSANLTAKLKALKDAGKPVFVTHEEWMQDSDKIETELMSILRNVLDGNYTANFSKEFDNKFRFLNNELKTFFKEIKQAYDLAKSQNLKVSDIDNVESELFKHKRIKIFYELFPVVWNHYEMLKRKNSVIDFNDLLSLVLDLFDRDESIRAYYREKYKCILVDEFQDVNPAQVQLVKYLFSESTDLFCVGDDWQSIYGFRGSDVNYIINFSHHFPESKVVKLKYNFRSSENIVRVGNEVIRNNKNKIEKEVLSLKKSDQKVILFKSNSEFDTLGFIQEKITHHLGLEKGLVSKDIMILGRRRDHFAPLQEPLKNTGVRFSTIHKAKGLEAKIVFVTGLKHGPGGFPDTWLSDSIYQVLKKTDKDILLEEERRLFYVAVTRAKDYLYLISENGNQSQFIDELPDSFVDEVVPFF